MFLTNVKNNERGGNAHVLVFLFFATGSSVWVKALGMQCLYGSTTLRGLWFLDMQITLQQLLNKRVTKRNTGVLQQVALMVQESPGRMSN